MGSITPADLSPEARRRLAKAFGELSERLSAEAPEVIAHGTDETTEDAPGSVVCVINWG